MRINNINNIAFSSSATVYGDPETFPTSENYPLIQTSTYGASKVSGESLIEAFCEYYDFKCWIFRFVSFIGERYTHGVIFDFMKKLFYDHEQLEILGDGKQKKSYLHVNDGVDAIFQAINKAKDIKNIFNLGHNESINVIKVADIISEEMELSKVKYTFTGGDRGWKGDSPFVMLDTTKIKNLGWAPKISIEDGIKRTVKYLLSNKELFNIRK
jgi:UDP-glucose 4-epimerase